MRLAWERPGIVRLTARPEEVASLVAAGRLALATMEGRPGEPTEGLARVLAEFDRAAHALRTQEAGRAADRRRDETEGALR
jgi:hypothetical protein